MRKFKTLIFLVLILFTIVVQAQQKENEKIIKKGISRFYNFNIRTPSRIYFLSTSRYDPYAHIFTGAISRVDSINDPSAYVLQRKEMQLFVDTLVFNSVFISIDLKDIRAIKQLY